MRKITPFFLVLAFVFSACQSAPKTPDVYPSPVEAATQAEPTAEAYPPPGLEAAGGPPGDSYSPTISSDGGVVAFISRSNLQSGVDLATCNGPDGQPNPCSGVYVYDIENGMTRLASISTGGVVADGNCYSPDLSGDGRFVVFSCEASNLAQGKTDRQNGIFIRDMQTGATNLVAAQGSKASISDNGRFVAYDSLAENWEIFVHDGQTGNTLQVSRSTDFGRPTGASQSPIISADGKWVAFWSWNGNLVREDLEGCGSEDNLYNCGDIFLYNGETAAIKRVKIGEKYGLGMPALSISLTGDGRLVTFQDRLYDRLGSPLQPLCGDISQPCTGGKLSANGRWVVYRDAMNYFIFDRTNANRTQVNVLPDGQVGDGEVPVYLASSEGDGFEPGFDLSADGQRIVFATTDANLADGDTNTCANGYFAPHNCLDVYLFDQSTGQITWVSRP